MNFDPFDHRAYQRLELQWRERLFAWAAQGAGVPVDDLELYEGELKLKVGRIIARQNLDRAVKADWLMVESGLAFSF